VIRPIVQLGDPVLRHTAKKVHRVDDGVKRLIDDMIDSLHEASGIGLAAPQIGVPLRVIITNLDDELRVFVNPEVVSRSEETLVADEACLSIRGYAGPVERSMRCEVRALNERGKKVKMKADEWFARCLQHEVDHLNGVLYIDRVEDKNEIHRVEENYEVEPDDGGENREGMAEDDEDARQPAPELVKS
jgi:peptide deformylase